MISVNKGKFPLKYYIDSSRWNAILCSTPLLIEVRQNWVPGIAVCVVGCFLRIICFETPMYLTWCSLILQGNVVSDNAGTWHRLIVFVGIMSVWSFVGKLKIPKVNYLGAADKEMRWKFPKSLKSLTGIQVVWVALVGSGRFKVVVFKVTWVLHRKISYVKNMHIANIMPTVIIGDFSARFTIIIEDPTINFWLGSM